MYRRRAKGSPLYHIISISGDNRVHIKYLNMELTLKMEKTFWEDKYCSALLLLPPSARDILDA